MKISVHMPHSVKECLLASLGGLLAFSVVACSQSQEPEVVQEPITPAVSKVKSGGSKRPARAFRTQPTPAPEAVVHTEPVTEPETTPAPEPQPAFAPVELPSPFIPSAPGKRIAQVSVPGPYVAVTFDDGPSATLTPQVLDIFARHGAHATFFVQGQNANRNRSIIARAVAEGHELGSHTWSHINMRASSTASIIRELDRTAAVIEEVTGSRPKVMRPPYGATNPTLTNMVYKRYGTPAILWDVDTQDWRKPGVQTVVNRAVGRAKPGSIILLHDIHASTLAAVEDIVTGLQARGFTLVTVSELIAMGREAAGVASPAPAEVETPPAAPVVSVEPVTPAAPLGTVISGAPSAAPLEQPVAPAVIAEEEFNFYEE